MKAGVDIMEDNRQNLRRHIKAASEWLIQAEKSIESKNDVQGDLKIMLAKAELQNAEKHRKQTWLKKFLSMTVAAAIAFGIYSIKNMNETQSETATVALNESNNESDTQKISVEIVPEMSEQSIKSEIPAESNEVEQETINESITNAVDTEIAESQTYEQESKYNQSELDLAKQNEEESFYEPNFDANEAKNISVEPNYVSEMPPAVINTPSQDMQKLMQSAGQILRAE